MKPEVLSCVPKSFSGPSVRRVRRCFPVIRCASEVQVRSQVDIIGHRAQVDIVLRSGGDGTVRLASRYMDVVCTSGPGTGVAASVEKVRRMREALGEEGLLALASGVATQPDNVDGYLPYVDFYLVATGISKDFLTFDPTKVKDLLDRIKGA